jgi:hypothetical protein
VGLGIGYEIATFALSANGNHASRSYRGVEFTNLEAGIDYLATPELRLGMFVQGSVGQFMTAHQDDAAGSGNYSIPQTGIHGWLLPGLRLRSDF